MPTAQWTYSGDPASSPKDELRFLIQDVDPQIKLLSDRELLYLLNTWMPRYDSVTYVAAKCAALIARKFAGIMTVEADGVTVDISKLSGAYATLAQQLVEEYNEAQDSGATVDMSNVLACVEDWDPSIAPLNFGIGMNDNPAVGQQAYSGRGEWAVPAIEWEPGWLNA